MMEKIKVVISGVCGKMGQAMLKGIIDQPDIAVVGGVDCCRLNEDIGSLIGISPCQVVVENDLDRVLKATRPDVLLDLTNPSAVSGNIRLALKNQVAAVIGTTGLTDDDLAEISLLSQAAQRPVFIVPNFALGAVLMMRFAQEAQPLFSPRGSSGNAS